MIPGLAARRWDMINTGMFYTEERARLMYLVRYEDAGGQHQRAARQPAQDHQVRGPGRA